MQHFFNLALRNIMNCNGKKTQFYFNGFNSWNYFQKLLIISNRKKKI